MSCRTSRLRDLQPEQRRKLSWSNNNYCELNTTSTTSTTTNNANNNNGNKKNKAKYKWEKF